jgi:hypothetical protein
MKIINFIVLFLVPMLLFSLEAVFEPNPCTALLGEELNLSIELQETTDFRGYRLVMQFDEELISFDSAAAGSLFQGQNIGWWIVDVDTPGELAIECIIFGAGIYISGPGTILELTFDAVSEGAGILEITEFTCYDPTGVIIPDCSGSDGYVIIGSNIIYAELKCWLEGAFLDVTMSTTLQPHIPLSSPYAIAPAVISEIPDNMVDWVLVELRSEPAGSTITSRSCLLMNNGYVASIDHPLVLFYGIDPGDYYVIIRHRNHISLMSSYPVPFNSNGSYHYCDLGSSTNLYGSGGYAILNDRTCGLIAGDADQDGGVYPSDRNEHWRIQSGSSGYLSGDFNLDGNVFPNDRNNFWSKNSGMGTNVPLQR